MSKQPDEQSIVPEDVVDAAQEQQEDELANASHFPSEGDGAADLVESALSEGEQMDGGDGESLRAELDEAQHRVLRLQAELENYRKRAQRTLDEERRYACLPLMRDLLPVVDNLQRALDAAKDKEDSAGLLEGVKIVADQLIATLKKHHCEEIHAEGVQFDPNRHEAIAQFPSEEHEPGAITQVTQAGYQLHDRVIRPSQVIIAAAKPDGE